MVIPRHAAHHTQATTAKPMTATEVLNTETAAGIHSGTGSSNTSEQVHPSSR